jgi:3-oxoacyl-[acyl-carrier-protein] synthase II
VTGTGAITALGPDPLSLWDALCRGQRGFGEVRGFCATGCRVQIAAEVGALSLPAAGRWLGAQRDTRAAALATHTAWQALERSRLTGRELDRTGLVLGSTASGDRVLEAYLGRRPGRERSSAARMLMYPKTSLAQVVADTLGLGGPRAVVNTACSSGLVAIIAGLDWLRSGFCDAVVAGGVDPLTYYTLTGFCSLRALDPMPCRPFDRHRRGLTLGEGAAVMVLERLDDARRRGASVLGIVAGAGVGCDAHHLTAPDPEGRGAARVMQAALVDAGIEPRDVGFINAHGTGTPHNDRAELASVAKVFEKYARTCPLSTVKGHIGHCLGAAGAIEAVVTLESLRRGWVPPTAGLLEPESADSMDFVMGSPRAVSARFGLTNSFGFGGNNASLIFAQSERGS